MKTKTLRWKISRTPLPPSFVRWLKPSWTFCLIATDKIESKRNSKIFRRVVFVGLLQWTDASLFERLQIGMAHAGHLICHLKIANCVFYGWWANRKRREKVFHPIISWNWPQQKIFFPVFRLPYIEMRPSIVRESFGGQLWLLPYPRPACWDVVEFWVCSEQTPEEWKSCWTWTSREPWQKKSSS